MSIIEETRQKTMQETQESYLSNSELEWEKQKQKIMQEHSFNSLGSLSHSETLTNMSNTTPSIINSRNNLSHAAHTQHRTLMTDIEMEFAKEVFVYNEKLVTKETPKPDLLANFTNLVQRFKDKNLEDAWNMLYYMTNLPEGYLSEKHTAVEKNFNREMSVKIQMFFVNQSLGYLEHCFKEVLQNTVNANLKQAKIGGAPGTLPLVTGFLRLKESARYHNLCEETFDDKQPLWPTIYLCLRCGDIDAARSIALKTKKEDIANYLDELLKERSNFERGHLNSTLENKLKLEYKSRIKRGQDVYKRAVYSCLCRLSGDDESLQEVLDNVDNFLWFKLNSIVFTSTSSSKDLNASTPANSDSDLTFQEFQTKLSIDFGEKYFTQNRNPFTYLQVLLLTAQFELAIEFLLKYDTMIVHGVHMALALFERNFLNLSKSSPNSLLITCGDSSESKCLRRINFACLIRMYTRKFECTDPREALEYYYFLRNLRSTQIVDTSAFPASKQPTNYFSQFVLELALETREFEVLFGRLEKNSVRRQGIIDKFIGEEEAASIIELVAHEMDNKGLVEEAIQLYDLCKQYQLVLELCNKLISQVVTEVNVANSNRDRLKAMCSSIAVRYKTEINMSKRAIPKSTITTFYLLTDLMLFFDLFHDENLDLAYDTIIKLGILPVSSNGVDSKVKEFIAFSEEIKRNFPDLILATMTIISNLFTRISQSSSKSNSYQNTGNSLFGESHEKKQMLFQLKEHAKALIKFVGCIPYRLSGDVNARLLQLEVMMN
jgi:nuclear pore complex protein Nup93